MEVFVKKPNDIKKIRIAGRLAAKVLEMIESYVVPGVTTFDLDRVCHKYITELQGAVPAALGYKGFPKSICTSVNEEVCHGIPSKNTVLKHGDIVNIDVAIIKDGLYGDTSKMFIVGKASALVHRLCKKTQESLYLAINLIKPGIRLGELGKSIQCFIEQENFSVVREYCGHGIGKKFHEEPYVFHYATDNASVVLRAGMVFTIEPMVNVGKPAIYLMEDGWTVKTQDHSLSAQYEHMVIVTEDGCEIVTLRSDDSLPFRIYHDI